MNKTKRNILYIVMALTCCLIGVAVWYVKYNNLTARTSYVVSPISMSYMIDPDDLENYMRDVDYVFRGSVNKLVGTEYRHKQVINNKAISTPYTKLEVKVTKIYKGNVSKGDVIQLLKMGGISADGKNYFLCEDDIIPEEGKEYTFLGYVQESGELIVTGKNSTIEKKNAKMTNKVEKALPAVEKRGDTQRERYVLDEKYKEEK